MIRAYWGLVPKDLDLIRRPAEGHITLTAEYKVAQGV
jgi:hypothetical protein